jgi:5S rRNA maturation endonuclease (ribonuclease M5)
MVEYVTCPSCNRERKTLAVYSNNVRCHACGYYSKEHELLGDTVTTMNTHTKVNLPNITPFEWTSKRISPNVLDLYGVGMSDDGKIVSPHYSVDMQLLAYHTRTPGERDFRMHGSNCPIGLHTLGNNKELIICEGHTDTYAAKTVFPKCDVIGIPGSDTVNTLKPYMSYIRKYKRITVMTDGDSAGNKCGDALIELLPKSKTYRTQLADGMDVSEYLATSRDDELVNLYKLSTSNKSGRFVTEEDCDKYATSKMYDCVDTGIPALNDMLGGGIGVAELTLLTGYTGIGKSAVAQMIAVNAAKSGVKVMYIAGEMTPKQNLDRLVRQWYGGLILRDDLANAYKEVSSSILITKFSDLTLHTVTDTIHEGVLDHGVRLVIVDVLSDIENFLSTDMTHPSRIIKAIHAAARGDEQDDVPPCAVLAVAHTKGNDEGRVQKDDIRGGSIIRQEATCIIGFNEEKVGDMSNTNRVLTLLKRPRNRDHVPEDVTLTYNTKTQQYTEGATNADTSQVRQQSRKTIPSNVPTPGVSPEEDIRLREQATNTNLPVASSATNTITTGTTEQVSEPLQSRLLLCTDTDVHRDKGNTQDRGPYEVPTSSTHVPDDTVQVSGTVVHEGEHDGTNGATNVAEQTREQSRLNALRRMYEKHPTTLHSHRTHMYKKNDLIRANLTALGYELQ